jgi:hypothetical protein
MTAGSVQGATARPELKIPNYAATSEGGNVVSPGWRPSATLKTLVRPMGMWIPCHINMLTWLTLSTPVIGHQWLTSAVANISRSKPTGLATSLTPYAWVMG